MRRLKIAIMLILYYIIAAVAAPDTNAQAYNWTQLGYSNSNGTNGAVYSITVYNNKMIAAGSFTSAGGVIVNNIAGWDGVSWTPLSSGTDGIIYAVAVYNGVLYAAGTFNHAGGLPAKNIAQWNGTGWSAVGTGNDGTDSSVWGLTVFNSKLVAGGFFTHAGGIPANGVAAWDGSAWSSLGSGITGGAGWVYSVAVLGTNLYAAGRFTIAGGNSAKNIAQWNGSSWSALTGEDINGEVRALTVHNNQLYAAGAFNVIGTNSVNHIALWNGTSWYSLNGGVSDNVYSLASFNGMLIAGGDFKYAGSQALYVDRIAKWNSQTQSWSRMITGTNAEVYALTAVSFNQDTTLYAGGDFTTAGGKYCYRIAKWHNDSTSTVSGNVKYADNSQPVLNGRVKILRRDVNSQEVIISDSGIVSNGTYSLSRVPRDSTLRVIIFPNDPIDRFVPTYFPSAIDWAAATPVNPVNNLVNINVNVFRLDTTGSALSDLNVGGYAYLNFAPPLNQMGNFPYNSDAIVYLKQGNIFKGYGISNSTEQYSITSHVPPGNYDALVYRIGYQHSSRQITVGNTNLDTVNFYLDTSTAVIGIRNISSQVPSKFDLSQNYPNPFNPSTKIKFSVTKAAFASMKVYNILGQEVALLVNESVQPGEYEVTFNAAALPSGIYFYRLVTNDASVSQNTSFSETKKMILIK